MATKKLEIPLDIYQIKITLMYTTPPIWRRVLVPAGMTMEQLHNVVQAAMGWEHSHLHDFRIGNKRFGEPDPYGDDMQPATINERTVRLFSVLGKVGTKAVYTYDFGDSWEHTISVEKVLPPDPEVAYPVCTGGKLHGPPEDCGGIPGYYNLVEILGDPAHDRYEEMLEWLGDGFDPDAFSVDETNRRLQPLRPRRAKS